MNRFVVVTLLGVGLISFAAACSSSSSSPTSSSPAADAPPKSSDATAPGDAGGDAGSAATPASTDGGDGGAACQPMDLNAGGDACRTCYNTQCMAQTCACEAAGPYDGVLKSQCFDYVVCVIDYVGAVGGTRAEAEKYCASGQSGETYTAEEVSAGNAFDTCVFAGACAHDCTGK